MKIDFVAEAQARVVPDIGQIDHTAKLALLRAVRAGKIARWQGRWAPEAGSPYGFGPLKTCYGPLEIAAYYRSMSA